MLGEVQHSGLVAEERAFGPLRRRVNGEDGNLVSALECLEPKPLNEGAFACTWNACEANAHTRRLARSLVQQRFNALLMLWQFAFDPRDGLGKRISFSFFDCSRQLLGIPTTSFLDEGFGGGTGTFLGAVVA
jgi:hypothetical protein